MMTRPLRCLLVAAIAGVLILPATPATAQPALADPQEGAARELLRQAIDLYVVGRYREAAERLRPLVETRVLQDRTDQGEALRAYGISLFLTGARAGAERAFRDLLRLEPSARMDPTFVRPEVVEFFEAVRARHRAELNALHRRSSSAAPNLLPPWGQFRNGHRTKGFLILGGEALLLATVVTSFTLLKRWEGPTREFPGHEGSVEPLKGVNYGSAAALAALVLYGIIDGYVYYRRLLGPGGREQPAAMRSDAPSAIHGRLLGGVSF